jgi:REP element-mobilizing transposase RayT
MSSGPPLSKRRPLRLPEYDYSQQGAYFVTLVVYRRQHLFGQIQAGEMELNEFGDLVANTWLALPTALSYCELDEWVVMPDHFHGILWLHEDRHSGEAAGRDRHSNSKQDSPAASPLRPTGPMAGSLGEVVQRFKSITTRRINILRRKPTARLWLRNYFERVIRNQSELDRARAYIRNNPLQWQIDHAEDEDWWQAA